MFFFWGGANNKLLFCELYSLCTGRVAFEGFLGGGGGVQEAVWGLQREKKKTANPLSVAFRDIAGCWRDSAS